MFPSFPEFKKLELSDRAAFESHMQAHPRGICELSFATLYLWQDFDRPRITTMDGNLCVRIEPLDEAAYFLEPVGDRGIMAAAAACVRHTGRIARATAGFVGQIRGNGFHVKEERDHHDYVYRVQELAELKGRRYDGKRNHIKGLLRRYPGYEYVPLRKEHAPEATALFERWCRARPTVQSGAERPEDLEYECQRRSLARAFEAYDELGLVGGALLLDGAIAGFVIASRLTPETACLHLEYHRPHVPGLAQTLLWEVCRTTCASFEYVNLEQDLGIEGLRRHKTSYHPLRLEEKFEVAPAGPALREDRSRKGTAL